MTIIAHNFDGIQINQTSEDTMIAGHLIPKGWVNATAMCKVNGKTWSNYWKLKSSKSFASSVSTALLIGRPATISIEGGNDKNLQGTWVHYEIAKHLYQWLEENNKECSHNKSEARVRNNLNKKLKGEMEVVTPSGNIDRKTRRKPLASDMGISRVRL